MQLKLAIVWMPVFVLSALASEQGSYGGDSGELILDLVLKNTPDRLNYRDLCVCSATNKAVAHMYVTSKTERLKLVHDELKQHVMTKHKDISADNIVASPQFPAAGYAYKVSHTPYFECLRMNSNGEFENNTVALASKVGTIYNNCAKKPHYMNDTFCFVYQCCDAHATCVPYVVYINRLGKTSEHPFPQSIKLNSEETHVLSTYFLRDICRVKYYANAIKDLKPESQYKLANLFACYASPGQMLNYVEYCCSEKSEYFWWLGTLKMSVIEEKWEFNNYESRFYGEGGAVSVFKQATLRKIEQLKEGKCFVKAEEQMEAFPWKYRVQQWQAFINYLNNKRITLKRCGNTILRYDDLSDTVRIITCACPMVASGIEIMERLIEFPTRMINISKPITLQKDADISTLEYTKDRCLKYHLLQKIKDDTESKSVNLLSYFVPFAQHKNWIFSEKVSFLDQDNEMSIREKL